MTGLARRRRTAQQIFLRRALSRSIGRSHDAIAFPDCRDRENGGIMVLPSLSRDPLLVKAMQRSQERSSSRAVKKLQRVLATNPFKTPTERKKAGKIPALKVLRNDAWRINKPQGGLDEIYGSVNF
ncbi:hypothetical protein KR026_012338 [Drosophila bipectinata]|nr:hypothetical protein KR026_012338 [Drosophila bipectinata]